MWRTRDGHWTSFSAYTQPASTIYPYVGAYMGRDHSGGFVHLMYRHGHLTDFKIRDTVYGDVPVHNNRFDACLARICVQGKWDDDNFIVGKWRHSDSSHWYSWEVHGYAH